MSSTIATAAGPVRFQILSDLHLEIPMTLDRCPALQGFAPDPSASVLALLGDIGDPLPGEYRSASYRSFIYAQAEVFEYVLLLTGNHEYYHHHQEQVHDAIEQLCREAPRRNVVFLHKSSFDYRGVRFLGCTLWIPLDGAPQSGTSDYKAIKLASGTKITWEDTNAWHHDQQQWLAESLATIRANLAAGVEGTPHSVVVLTHHAPTCRNTMNPRWCTPEAIAGSCSDQEHLMGDPVRVWAFGHTHYSSDQVIHGTRVVSNQLGYCMKGQSAADTRFTPNFVIEVPPAAATT